MEAVSGSQAKSLSPVSNNPQVELRQEAAREEALKKAQESKAAEQGQAPRPGVEVTLSEQVEQASRTADARNERQESRAIESRAEPQSNASFSKAASFSTAQEGQRQIDELV